MSDRGHSCKQKCPRSDERCFCEDGVCQTGDTPASRNVPGLTEDVFVRIEYDEESVRQGDTPASRNVPGLTEDVFVRIEYGEESVRQGDTPASRNVPGLTPRSNYSEGGKKDEFYKEFCA